MIQEYIKACIDASPSVVQGTTYAAAVKGQMFNNTYKQKLNKNTPSQRGMPLVWPTRTHE